MSEQNQGTVVEEQISQGSAEPSSGVTEGGGAGQGPAEGAPAAPSKEGTPDISPPAEGEDLPPAAFVPRDKFKVKNYDTNAQDEHEVPKWLKDSVKDAETEKQALALLEKAYGLEPVKASRAAAQKERDHFRQELSSIQKTIVNARQTYQRGDIDSFLNQLAIPHERMLQWALSKVEYSQLPPEQQRLHDERIEAQRRAWTAEETVGHTQEQFLEQARSAKQAMLSSSLARPDVQTFSEAFDQKAGRPGAFVEEVSATGHQAWTQSQGKVDLSPDQAIEQVMKKWSPFLQVQSATSAAAAPGKAAPSAKPAIIPNVQGGSTSALKSKPRSIEDLKKLAKSAG